MVGLDRKKAIYFGQRKKKLSREERPSWSSPLRCSFAVSSVLYKAVIILWTKIPRNRHNESAIFAPPLPTPEGGCWPDNHCSTRGSSGQCPLPQSHPILLQPR